MLPRSASKGTTPTKSSDRILRVFFTADDIARNEPARILAVARTKGKYEGEGWRVRKDSGRFWVVGNVVRHAHGGAVELAVDHGGAYSVLHVVDRGCGFHHISRLPLDPYAENGRGLLLIAALSVDFTVSERPDGGSDARVALRGRARTARTRAALQCSPANA
jgi:hypothetical protein